MHRATTQRLIRMIEGRKSSCQGFKCHLNSNNTRVCSLTTSQRLLYIGRLTCHEKARRIRLNFRVLLKSSQNLLSCNIGFLSAKKYNHVIFFRNQLTSSVFPVVIKIGHAHRGMAKFKVHDHYEFQDVAGVAAMAGTYVIVEQFVDAAYDVRVQKIGADYKSYK